MNKTGRLILVFISLGIILAWRSHNLSSAQSTSETNSVRYHVVTKESHIIHTVTIPHDSNYTVIPVVSGQLQAIADFIKSEPNQVIAAINGGYFDPVNQKTTSFITQQEKIVADPRFNERLVDNPDLKEYLGKIFNRAEFRRYNCGQETKYDIQLHSTPIPKNCTLIESLGAGPSLLPQDTSVTEGFTAYQAGKKIRDAIGADSLNARSAVGITANGDVILVMVGQKPDKPLNSGISLPELANFLSSLGATKAMNLDGGSSASLYYQGQNFYGRVDKDGKKIQRPIKSILAVTSSK
jgi:exopolysaccharide biosynthesis protein